MMDFEEFKNEIKDRIKEFLSDKFEDAAVSLSDVIKNNGMKLTGIVIKEPESNVAPTIYIDSFFKDYENGRGLDDILQNIADIRDQNELDRPFDTNAVTDLKKVQDRVTLKLVNKDANKDLLSKRPHTDIGDLSYVYQIDLKEMMGKGATTPVTNALMERYGIDIHTLHQLAEKNTPRIDPPEMFRMEEKFGMPYDPDEKPMMMVITNHSNVNGASAITFPGVREQVAEQLDTDNFYILPSSVHETIAVPNTGDKAELENLKDMVKAVNASEVDQDERLPDNVYLLKGNMLVRADQEEMKENDLLKDSDRSAEKAAEYRTDRKPADKDLKTKPVEKESLKAKLKEKKAEIGKKAPEKAVKDMVHKAETAL